MQGCDLTMHNTDDTARPALAARCAPALRSLSIKACPCMFFFPESLARHCLLSWNLLHHHSAVLFQLSRTPMPRCLPPKEYATSLMPCMLCMPLMPCSITRDLCPVRFAQHVFTQPKRQPHTNAFRWYDTAITSLPHWYHTPGLRRGRGNAFLRHVSRCSAVVVVVDGEGGQPGALNPLTPVEQLQVVMVSGHGWGWGCGLGWCWCGLGWRSNLGWYCIFEQCCGHGWRWR